MKNILVPTDFSGASRNAVKYAASFAQSFDANIILINVVSPLLMTDDSILGSVLVTEAEISEENKEKMEQEVEGLSKKYSVSAKGFVREGFTLDIIFEMAKVKHADLIVMGMKGKGKSNSVFGSTTTALIRKSNYPVLIIPEKVVYKPIDNIIFATDFDTTVGMSCYKELLAIAKKFNSQIHILNVQKKETSLIGNNEKSMMRINVAFSKHKHHFHTINEKNVEEGIHKFIAKNPADILAMVAHKHSLSKRVFGKVHTKAMSYQTKIPLLVLQSKKD